MKNYSGYWNGYGTLHVQIIYNRNSFESSPAYWMADSIVSFHHKYNTIANVKKERNYEIAMYVGHVSNGITN